MTTLNITSKSTVAEEIEKIEKERDLKIALIEEQFPMIDKKFEAIYGYTWRKILEYAQGNRIEKDSEEALKAVEINKRLKEKISMIRKEAAEKIHEIRAEEKAAKLADLDQYINEICA